MPRITKERLALARTFLQQYDKLERKACSRVEWLMLKFSCSRLAAARLAHAVDQDTTTENIGRTPVQRRPQ
jgi:hypothetical protein